MNQAEQERVDWIDRVEPEMDATARTAAVEALGAEPGASARAVARVERKGDHRPIQRHEVSASAMRRPDGGHVVLSMVVKSVRPYGEPRPEGDAHTLASRLAGKKPPGQVPAGAPGILWMDLSDPDWAMSVKDTLPIEVFRKGLNLGTTHGIWHSFYGRRGQTPLMERTRSRSTSAGESSRRRSSMAVFVAMRNAVGPRAILRCVDGLVIFEHPQGPSTLLPMKVLRELIDLDGYAPYASVHRFDDDPEAVSRRLDEIEKMLAFYAA